MKYVVCKILLFYLRHLKFMILYYDFEQSAVPCLLCSGVLTCCNGVATTHLVCQLIIQTLFISATIHQSTVGHAQGVGRH